MKLAILSTVAVSLLCGCGAMYEDVPVYGQSDPSYAPVDVQTQAPRTAAAIGIPNYEASVDPGQVGDAQDQYTDTDPSALSDFKQTLDPYGTWQDDPTYGTMWRPDPGVVGADFAPYVTGGHWGYDDDYVWLSDYDWGWAPFHYGRWIYSNGWGWIPGRRYAGAWVNWRTGGPGYGYVGWGPTAPTWGWRNGTAYNYGFNVNTPYSFCETRNLFAPSLQGHTLGGATVNEIAGHTQPWGGRDLAHPGVGGPTPSHLGINNPPPIDRANPGWSRIQHAQAWARPSTAGPLGGHQPNIPHPQQVPYPPQGALTGANRAVVTGPHYVGGPFNGGNVSRPYYSPYQSHTIGGSTPYGGSYGARPSYTGAPYHYSSPSSPYHMGGAYHIPTGSPSYGHSYSHSYSRGGGGGHGHR